MMFFLLVKMRVSSALNIARDSFRRSPWLAACLSLLGIGLFLATYFGFLFFFHLASQMSALSETAYQIFYFLFLFLLAGSVPFIASTLLHSADYSLLFSAPVPPRAVVAAKLLDATVTNSLQFTVLGFPAIVACAAALRISLLGWLLLPFLIVLFVLLPALLTAFGLLLLLWIMGIDRLRAAVTALNALMATVVCITIVLEASHLPVKPGVEIFSAQTASITSSSPAARLFPSAWFTDLLNSLSSQNAWGNRETAYALGKIALLVGSLYWLCLLLGGKLLTAANLAEESGSEKVLAGEESSDLWKRLFSAPVAALLIKDWKYIRRDSVLLSQLLMPLILFVVPFLLAMQDSPLHRHSENFPFAGVIIGVIVFMQTSILSLSSIGLESRSFWVVMTSPNGSARLLYAKFLLSALFASAVGIVLTLIASVAFDGDKLLTVLQMVVVVFSSAALSGLGVGLSAAFPRFVYENPAHRVSAWALILGFFASTGYVLVSGILFAVAWLLSINLPGGNNVIIYSLAALLYLALTAYAIYAPLTLGARRIERYQWEH